MLRRIYGLKRAEMVGSWRKLYDEELRNLYCLLRIIRTMTPRMRWSGHVSCGEGGAMDPEE
jgi:hypothetical protein